jgi:hypothetical protein
MNPITFRHLAIGTGMLKSADVAIALLFMGPVENRDVLPRAVVLVVVWLILWTVIWKLTGTKVFVRPAGPRNRAEAAALRDSRNGDKR